MLTSCETSKKVVGRHFLVSIVFKLGVWSVDLDVGLAECFLERVIAVAELANDLIDLQHLRVNVLNVFSVAALFSLFFHLARAHKDIFNN